MRDMRRPFVFGAVVVGAALVALGPIADGDIYWHLAAGDEIWRRGALLRTDPFTVSAAGRAWVDVHWLFQVAVALIHRAFGFGGLAVAKAVLVAAGAALGTRTAERAGGPAARDLCAAALLGLLFLARHLLPLRPIVATLLFLAAFLAVLERQRLDTSAPARRALFLPPRAAGNLGQLPGTRSAGPRPDWRLPPGRCRLSGWARRSVVGAPPALASGDRARGLPARLVRDALRPRRRSAAGAPARSNRARGRERVQHGHRGERPPLRARTNVAGDGEPPQVGAGGDGRGHAPGSPAPGRGARVRLVRVHGARADGESKCDPALLGAGPHRRDRARAAGRPAVVRHARPRMAAPVPRRIGRGPPSPAPSWPPSSPAGARPRRRGARPRGADRRAHPVPFPDRVGAAARPGRRARTRVRARSARGLPGLRGAGAAPVHRHPPRAPLGPGVRGLPRPLRRAGAIRRARCARAVPLRRAHDRLTPIVTSAWSLTWSRARAGRFFTRTGRRSCSVARVRASTSAIAPPSTRPPRRSTHASRLIPRRGPRRASTSPGC